MSKIHFVDQSRKGVIVASIFKKANGMSLAFNNQIKKDGKFVDAEKGTTLLEIMYGDNMWIVPNNKKVAGDKLPEYIVYAYPEDNATEETPTETPAEETTEA